MSDIFREVDEEVRKDKSLEFWKRYGAYVIAASVAIMAVTGGVMGWRSYQKSQRIAEAQSFLSAASLTGEAARAAALKQVAEENQGVYGAIARIRLAMEMADTNPDGALAALDEVAGATSLPVQIRQLAEIRAAGIAADAKSAADLLERVTPLLEPSHAFRYSARELAAVAELELGNREAARAHLNSLIEDQRTPAGIRARTEAMLAIIGEGVGS